MTDKQTTATNGGPAWLAELHERDAEWMLADQCSAVAEEAFRKGHASNREANTAHAEMRARLDDLKDAIWRHWPNIKHALFAHSETRESEGYPGIAHDLETMRAALAELVALKDMKEALDDHAAGVKLLPGSEWFATHEGYRSRKPLAWQRARDAIKSARESGNTPTTPPGSA